MKQWFCSWLMYLSTSIFVGPVCSFLIGISNHFLHLVKKAWWVTYLFFWKAWWVIYLFFLTFLIAFGRSNTARDYINLLKDRRDYKQMMLWHISSQSKIRLRTIGKNMMSLLRSWKLSRPRGMHLFLYILALSINETSYLSSFSSSTINHSTKDHSCGNFFLFINYKS